MFKKACLGLIGILGLAVVATSATAATDCNGVSVVATGTTAYTASGLFVKVQNNSGAACGDLANGAQMQYFVDEVNADRTYATILTALSLNRSMFIQVGGTGAKNSLLSVAAIKPN